MYYSQVYAFYQTMPVSGEDDVQLVSRLTGLPGSVAHDDYRAIDADSSPIRYRACFVTPLRPADLLATHVVIPGAVPRTAPPWFHCYDADAIGAALDAGTATAFLGQKNVRYGVDRIVAITDDGRGFAWNELNDCGEKAYDGTQTGQACPPRPGKPARN
jgi:hypothetical protein